MAVCHTLRMAETRNIAAQLVTLVISLGAHVINVKSLFCPLTISTAISVYIVDLYFFGYIFVKDGSICTYLFVPEPDDFEEEKFEPHNHENDHELTCDVHVLISVAIFKVSVQSAVV